MFFVERSAEIDYFIDDSVDDDESLCWEEFGPFFRFVDFEFTPEPIHAADVIVLAESWRMIDAQVIPYIF